MFETLNAKVREMSANLKVDDDDFDMDEDGDEDFDIRALSGDQDDN